MHKVFLYSVHISALKCFICTTVKFCDEEGFIFLSKKDFVPAWVKAGLWSISVMDIML